MQDYGTSLVNMKTPGFGTTMGFGTTPDFLTSTEHLAEFCG